MVQRRPPRATFGRPPQAMKTPGAPRVAPPPRPRPARRPLAAPPVDTRAGGDSGASAILAEALDAAFAATADADALTHGFHAYPARMHPAIAKVLVSRLARQGEVILDPFCGSGTVLLEAMLARRRAIGVDLNPLALRIAEVKCARRDRASRERLGATLAHVAAASEARVRARTYAHAPLTREDARWWEGHVLKELAGLREEIVLVEDEADRRALEVLLSAIVVKFSKQRADTSEEETPKRIRKGLATEFFLRKGRELVERWAALDRALPFDAEPPRLLLGDARRLARLIGPGVRVRAVISSPPYGGTYDYARHHARRLPWLGLDGRTLERDEIGARRRFLDPFDGERRWDVELLEALRAIADVLDSQGVAVLLMGDAEIAGRRIAAHRQLQRLAPRAGLQAVAYASQLRPDWHGGPPRDEHLVLLTRP